MKLRTLSKRGHQLLVAFGLWIGFTSVAIAANEVALVSTDTPGFAYFDLAKEASDRGASLIVFPEWGFYADEPDLPASIDEQWRMFARTEKVYVFLNGRDSGRNTVLVYKPDGTKDSVVRRDGNNSPRPSSSSELEPLIVNTPYGNAAVLICDEVRSRKFVEEVKNRSQPSADFIISPNLSGDFAGVDQVLERSVGMDYQMDVFIADTIGKFSFNGGNHTHAFRHKTQVIEVNRMGRPAMFASWDGLSSLPGGGKYFISYHDIQ